VVYVCDDDGYEFSNPVSWMEDAGGRPRGGMPNMRSCESGGGGDTLVCGGYDFTNSCVKRERNELDLVSIRLYI